MNRTTQLVGAINSALYEYWDPLGVNQDAAWPRDEYETYAGGIIGMIQSQASDNEIAEHLGALETGPLGVPLTSLNHRLNIVTAVRVAVKGIVHE